MACSAAWQIVAAELDPGGEQQRLHVLWRELQRIAENAQRLEVLLLAEEQLGEIVVRLDVARVLLDRLAQRVLGLFELAVLLKQACRGCCRPPDRPRAASSAS